MSKRCIIYDHCDGRPAVAEVVTTYTDGGVSVYCYCPKCLALARFDTSSTKRRKDGSHIVRGERVTWLTTLVNGEVPA